MKLRSKADVLFELKEKTIDWSKGDFQRINQLINVRNWLSHHKEPYLGLANADGYWVQSEERKHVVPKINILRELKKSSVQKYYQAVRNAGIEIFKLWDYEEIGLDSLVTEQYEPLIW